LTSSSFRRLEPHSASPTSTGAHENYSNVLKRGLRPALTAAKITRRVTVHDLRHAYASSMIRAGVEGLRVSRKLGHASADITLRVCGHSIKLGREDAAEKFVELTLGKHATNP
jgi:integrase